LWSTSGNLTIVPVATDVFISYPREAHDYVAQVAQWLAERGVNAWWDHQIMSGDEWERVIQTQVAACSAMVVVMMPEGESSQWMSREINLAEQESKPIFPLLLGGNVFFRLNNLQYEDVRGGRMPSEPFAARLRGEVGVRPAAPVSRQGQAQPKPRRGRVMALVGAALAVLTVVGVVAAITSRGGNHGQVLTGSSGSPTSPTGPVSASVPVTSSAPAKTPKIGVILPDSTLSVRWEQTDRKYLQDAFAKAGIEYDIQNALNSTLKFQQIADQMIRGGVTVLMTVNIDSTAGKAVLAQAKAAGIITIDYDRLTLNGGADYYVSFDNAASGKLMGQGLVDCLRALGKAKPVVAYLNGSPTDNAATVFRQGYDSVLKPKFDSGEYLKGPEASVPNWDNSQAATIFSQMYTSSAGKIDGVVAANDGLANAVITELTKVGLDGKVPVTGQDATVVGLQRILTGDQCMTVYKSPKREAQEAAQFAITLASGKTPAGLTTYRDPSSNRDVPADLISPSAVTKAIIKDVVSDGYVTKADLCAGSYATLCAQNGI
jgi:D-xylose transport system substrate-binding protein